MRQYFKSLRATEKGVLVGTLCALLTFGGATAFAALTFNATAVSSDGAIHLNPTGQPVTVNGNLTVTGTCTGCGGSRSSVFTFPSSPPITVGSYPYAIAITPDGATAYVVNYSDNTVTPITIASNTPGNPITVGAGPDAIAITPDGATAYVVNYSDNTVTPITVPVITPPVCDGGAEGSTLVFTNSNTAVWGATVVSPGSNHILAYCDGTNWTVAAK
jgi:hypothetical protein